MVEGKKAGKIKRGQTNHGNLLACLCYTPFIGWIVSFVVLIAEKKDSFARYNAIQGILLAIAFLIIAWLLGLIFIVAPILVLIITWVYWLVVIGVLIFMMYEAYTGVKVSLPLIGDIAEKYA